MNAKRISLIVSTYNWPGALAKVFRGLQNQTARPGEIIIADEGSGEPTRRLIEEWKIRLGVPLRHVWHEDLGFRKTIILNRALSVATGDYVVFLDGDCVPHRRFIEDHAVTAERGFWVQGRRCFVKEPWVSEFEAGKANSLFWLIGHRLSSGWKILRLPWPIVRRDMEQRGIIGCNMGFWRDDLIAVNGFDEEYFGWGIGEDSDLGTRLYHLGRPRKFIYGRALIYHLNHPSLSRDHLSVSLARLENTLHTRKVRCAVGLDRHVASTEVPIEESPALAEPLTLDENVVAGASPLRQASA